ncbi:hypothetical protein [Oryzifoliimicrobium ureilyticus]|uniref:hypothetical protein n=1 Tax=Oryzifoliimicrobium ureilyticus TaxID=3113724 RepID=UPI0030760F76
MKAAEDGKITEAEMVEKLEKKMHDLAIRGYDVQSIELFFGVGEWLIAFEGIENVVTSDNLQEDDQYLSLRRYFEPLKI